MKESITKEMKVQIMEAKLHKNLKGETLRLGIIEKMKPTKMPTWFKEWSETVYRKDISEINKRLDRHEEILDRHTEILKQHDEIFRRNNLQ